MNFYYVYVLQSLKTDWIYVGSTSDLRKRFKSHNNGENLSTKGYAPFKLIFYEAYLSKKDALRREEYFKKHRQTYFDMLYNYHTKGDVVSWLKFFLEGIAQTAKDAIETSRKITELREQDMEKAHSLGQTSKVGMKILKNLYKLPIVDVNKISEWSGYTRQGAYKLIDKFVDLGILEQKDTSQEYGKKYVYKKYLDIFV